MFLLDLWVPDDILRNQVSHLDNKLSYIKSSSEGRTSSKLKMFPTLQTFYFHKESRDFIRDLIQSEMKRLGMKPRCNKYLEELYVFINEETVRNTEFTQQKRTKKLSTVMNLPKYEDTVYKFNIQSGLTDVGY